MRMDIPPRPRRLSHLLFGGRGAMRPDFFNSLAGLGQRTQDPRLHHGRRGRAHPGGRRPGVRRLLHPGWGRAPADGRLLEPRDDDPVVGVPACAGVGSRPAPAPRFPACSIPFGGLAGHGRSARGIDVARRRRGAWRRWRGSLPAACFGAQASEKRRLRQRLCQGDRRSSEATPFRSRCVRSRRRSPCPPSDRRASSSSATRGQRSAARAQASPRSTGTP